MNRIFPTKIRLVSASMVSALAILGSMCPRATAAEKQTHELFAVLIDAVSKKPVSSITIVLALKEQGKDQCTVDPSLTGVSNAHGEVHIPNVKPGEYVVFQSPSGIIKPQLKEKVVTWGGSATGYNFSFGAVVAKKGTMVITPQGNIGIANGYLEGQIAPGADGVLGLSTTAEGALLTVHAPGAGSGPTKMDINTGNSSSPKVSTASTSVAASTAPAVIAGPGSCSAGLHFVAGRGCVPDLAPSPANATDVEDRGATFFQRSARLEWQKQPDQRLMKWEEGKAYCHTLSLGGGGWRMPTKEELHTLRSSKSSGGAAFPGMDDSYWSSSLKAGTSRYAWFVSFTVGGDSGNDAVIGHGRVRCVR